MADDDRLEFQIDFKDVSDVARAGEMAESLKEYLLDSDSSIKARRIRTDASSMDFGSAVVLLLSAPALVAVSKGISKFLERYQTASIRIKGPNGSLVVENLTSRQASDIAHELRKAWLKPTP